MSLPPIGPGLPWLAPLAGYSDLPFRLLCREYGAACAVTEMVSAKGLVFHSHGTRDLLNTLPGDAPLVVQLFGCEPEMFERAMDHLLEHGYEYFDLNCGCSVPKVVKAGCGSALMREPALLREIVRVMAAKAGPGRAGVKLRLGWGEPEPLVFELARALEDEGAGWLTLHPRHARQGYSGTAAWEHLARLKAQSRVPVMASGDLFNAYDARRCLDATGVDGVMFARGALYDPAVFRHFLSGTLAAPSGPEIARLVRRHAELIRVHGRPEKSLLRMRSIVPRYVRGLLGARALRQEASSCTSWERLEEIVEAIAASASAPGGLHGAHIREEWDGRS
ncbi:putative tRNA-dihydrouridine synthase [Fundidesulfovibrio magnetotacticus]|uniref:tRNA-dihydrouridine synthase n=1 Tax=Fundidesulfovibrio magnetotacticus TaxID=2730080 RepID=A0A6V8M5L8_9BACT|nr:tRNA-dihydrouridine synthase family protein [Fundidesulfovibrio magnetotacticus]GFK95865.1 putative tRNA-dihydrouridine synthase [Fundidesulfovibrio magnetotacticus]